MESGILEWPKSLQMSQILKIILAKSAKVFLGELGVFARENNIFHA